MITFVINRDSWHYAYYQWIRSMYGAKAEHEPGSLCPYCQTMFWGSIFCVVSIPLMIFGWVYMRLARLVCRWEFRYFDQLVEWLQCNMEFLDCLDKGPDRFLRTPVGAGFLYSIMGILSLFIIGIFLAFISVFLYAFGYSVFNISTVAYWALYAISSLGWAFFMGFSWIGYGLNAVWAEVAWLFTNGPFWYWLGSWAVYILAWTFGVGLCCIVLGLITKGIGKIPGVKRFTTWLVTVLNGFPEAKKSRSERIKAEKAARPEWICEYCEYKNEGIRDLCHACNCRRPRPARKPTLIGNIFGAIFGWIAVPFIWGSDTYHRVKDKQIIELSTSGVIWQTLLSLKKGVCPLVEFVDPGQLRAEALAAAVEIKEEEDEKKIALAKLREAAATEEEEEEEVEEEDKKSE